MSCLPGNKLAFSRKIQKLIQLIQIQSTLRQERPPMKSPEINSLIPSRCSSPPTIGITRSWSWPGCSGILALGLSLALLSLTSTARAASPPVSDNFDDATDAGTNGIWTGYEGSAGTREVQFPPDGSGGFAYRIINHAPKDESGIFTRGASIRNDANYQDQFFVASDVLTWNDTAMVGAAGTFVLAKAQTPGSLTTFGYLTGYLAGGPLAPQGLMLFIEFQSELQATFPDLVTGGAALTP